MTNETTIESAFETIGDLISLLRWQGIKNIDEVYQACICRHAVAVVFPDKLKIDGHTISDELWELIDLLIGLRNLGIDSADKLQAWCIEQAGIDPYNIRKGD